MLFTGNAHPTLAHDLAHALGMPLGNAISTQFADGESKIAVHDHVRGKDVFILQPTSYPANHHIIELCLLVDALQHAGASKITAIVPYFSYARMDYADAQQNRPHSARVIANIFNSLPIDHLITVDLHAPQISDYFTFKVDNLNTIDLFARDIKSKELHAPVIVAPDVGGVKRAQAIANVLGLDLAFICKDRCQKNDTSALTLLGNVKNRDCVVIDDIIDTGSTLLAAVNALKRSGAGKVVAYCTHGVLSGDALQRVLNSSCDSIVLSNCIKSPRGGVLHKKLRTVSIVPVLAEFLKNL